MSRQDAKDAKKSEDDKETTRPQRTQGAQRLKSPTGYPLAGGGDLGG